MSVRGAVRVFLLFALLGNLGIEAQTCASPPSNLVSWWALNGNADDLIGANNGSLAGVPGSFVSGKVGLGFRGTPGGYVSVPPSASLNVREFTIAGWFRIDAITDFNQAIWWKGNSSALNATSPFALGVCGTNPTQCPPLGGRTGQFFLTLGDGSNLQTVVSSTAAVPGRFYFVAVAVDTAELRLYVDGRLETL